MNLCFVQMTKCITASLMYYHNSTANLLKLFLKKDF